MCKARLWICVFLALIKGALAQGPDARLLRYVAGKPGVGWDKAMRDLSLSVYMVSPVPPLAIALHGYIGKNDEFLHSGFKSAIGLGTALALSTGLKYSIGRSRPFVTHAGYINGRDDPHTPSFPSGHTTAAFATATNLALTYKKWYVWVPAYAYAGLAAYSRMRLGLHYPSDVLGGMVIGTGSALLSWHLYKKIRQHRITKKKEAAVPEN